MSLRKERVLVRSPFRNLTVMQPFLIVANTCVKTWQFVRLFIYLFDLLVCRLGWYGSSSKERGKKEKEGERKFEFKG